MCDIWLAVDIRSGFVHHFGILYVASKHEFASLVILECFCMKMLQYDLNGT